MNTKKIAEAVKQHLVTLALKDKLPQDLNTLSVKALEKVINDVSTRDNIIEKANHLLSCCDTNEETVKMIKLIVEQAKVDEHQMIDNVDGVVVWQKVEHSFTCKEFLDEIGYEDIMYYKIKSL